MPNNVITLTRLPEWAGCHGASKVRKVRWDKSERVEVTLFSVAPDCWAAGARVSARYDHGLSDVLGREAALAGAGWPPALRGRCRGRALAGWQSGVEGRTGSAAPQPPTGRAEGALWPRAGAGLWRALRVWPCGPLAYQA